MPLKRCVKRGKNGWKFGSRGFCYTGINSKRRAMRQGESIEAQNKEKENKDG